jgi:hypothetical protein
VVGLDSQSLNQLAECMSKVETSLPRLPAFTTAWGKMATPLQNAKGEAACEEKPQITQE